MVFDELTSSCVMADECQCWDSECDDYVDGTDQGTCCPGRTWLVASTVAALKQDNNHRSIFIIRIRCIR